VVGAHLFNNGISRSDHRPFDQSNTGTRCDRAPSASEA
jgi:hypothetical protein